MVNKWTAFGLVEVVLNGEVVFVDDVQRLHYGEPPYVLLNNDGCALRHVKYFLDAKGDEDPLFNKILDKILKNYPASTPETLPSKIT
ncbi:hypothetical protein RvY_00263 [Ramazzottius varieornatus]|uniref:Uncharacterized protein n=1 Tax=Ramazzottius varieornatus TaxID=947166 RepID=A0A1D1UIH9_RAMVA|nr:hypothetical protein RvY_00263 [Ramazzottius varieornatus]